MTGNKEKFMNDLDLKRKKQKLTMNDLYKLELSIDELNILCYVLTEPFHELPQEKVDLIGSILEKVEGLQ